MSTVSMSNNAQTEFQIVDGIADLAVQARVRNACAALLAESRKGAENKLAVEALVTELVLLGGLTIV